MKRALALLLLLAGRAQAHPLLESRAEGVWSRERLSLDISVTLEQVWLSDTSLPGAPASYPAALKAMQRYAAALEGGLSLQLAGRPLPFSVALLKAPGEAQWRDEGSSSRIRYRLEGRVTPPAEGALRLAQSLSPARLDSGGKPYAAWLLVDIQQAESGKVFQGLADGQHAFVADPGAGPRSWGVAFSFLRAGFWHIMNGWDHLLFVGALVLAALAWWDVFALVGAFTLAHSLTLSLAVLGYAKLPASVVEPGISLSIVAVALLNLWRGPQELGKKLPRLLAAFAFGLLHGLGFAGGLLEAMQGLPALRQGLAILSFSAGVELGHMSVVVPLFMGLAWGRRRYPRGFGAASLRYGSMGIALAGLWYLSRAL